VFQAKSECNELPVWWKCAAGPYSSQFQCGDRPLVGAGRFNMEEHISPHALFDGKALQANIAAAFVTVATNRSNCCYSTMSS
tara:strand:- start:175 stop:420 length:246 start_codon:yes stop_codon:yes gene_type:complete